MMGTAVPSFDFANMRRDVKRAERLIAGGAEVMVLDLRSSVCVDGDVIGDEVENMRVDAWKLGFGSGFRDLTQVSDDNVTHE